MIISKYQLHRIQRSGYGNEDLLVAEFYDIDAANAYMSVLAESFIKEGYVRAKDGTVPPNHVLLVKIGDQIEFYLTSHLIDDTGAPWNTKEIKE